MIITISGRAGSGKSTIAELLAKKLKLRHYSSGDFMREMAHKRGLSLLELSKIAEKDRTIDEELDERQIRLGKTEDNFVIDGRLSAFFIPNSIKIFLDADKKERARRIMKDKRIDERSSSINEMIKKMDERENSEKRRYNEYYNFDCYDKKNYEIVIDSTDKQPEDVVEIILEKIKG